MNKIKTSQLNKKQLIQIKGGLVCQPPKNQFENCTFSSVGPSGCTVTCQ